jgi:glucose-6-phosphate isomerase
MSVIRPKPPEDPLEFAPGALGAALGSDAPAPPADEFERARTAAEDDPSVTLPDRLLADYNGTVAGRTRATSALYAVLQEARRIRDSVDRVVVLGDAGSTLGVQAIFACCCHPFHNELSRGERGGRPRLSCVGDGGDGDLLQGVIDLVAPAGSVRGDDLLEQWAIVICDDAPSAAAEVLLPLLLRSVGGDRPRMASRVASAAKAIGGAAETAPAIGRPRGCMPPDGQTGCRGALAPAVLLPAAIVGIDVVRLLQGAAAMNRRFREAAAAHNPVHQVVAASRLAARHGAAAPRLLSTESARLHDVVRWHERLVAPAAGAATTSPPAAVISLLAGEPRRDPRSAVSLGPPAADADVVGGIQGRAEGSPSAPAAAGEPPTTALIRLPRIDEHAIGQLLQLLLLATAVEERLAC